MADSPVRIDIASGVARVTLSRPPLNLFEPGIIEALGDAFHALAEDDSVRVAVLTGSGRAFCAGMDIRVLRGLDVRSAKTLITRLQRAIAGVHDAPFPVIGALNGAALGAGFELALACDLRIAVTGAPLGLPEVRVGLPSVIEAALLPAAVGPARAAELLFTGEQVSAEVALGWGLLNRVVPAAEFDAAVAAMVASITAASPAAVRLQKELVVRWRKTDLATAVQYGINAFAMGYATADPHEGSAAFVEKREPRWPLEPRGIRPKASEFQKSGEPSGGTRATGEERSKR